MPADNLYNAIVEVLARILARTDEPVPHRSVRALISRELHRPVSSDDYFAEIEELSKRGAVDRSRGQGGMVRLVPGISGLRTPPNTWTEPDLMPCLEKYLKTQFWKDLDLPSSDPICEWMVVDTSMSGTREGQWTRPDFTAICITPFRVLPVPQLSVYTFELKASAAGGTQAVHQSLNQTKMSNYGYFVWHPIGAEALLDAVESTCKKHGVGLVLIGDPQEPTTWEIRIEADRQPTSPEEIDRFLSSNRFTDEQRRVVRRKLSGII